MSITNLRSMSVKITEGHCFQAKLTNENVVIRY